MVSGEYVVHVFLENLPFGLFVAQQVEGELFDDHEDVGYENVDETGGDQFGAHDVVPGVVEVFQQCVYQVGFQRRDYV